MKHIFVVMGKSASGKDSIYREILKKEDLGLNTIVPYTTRPIRAGEAEGREYHFVSDEQFEKMKTEGRIIESRSYNTVHGIWTYFTADDEQIRGRDGNGILIGTLESYCSMLEYFPKGFLLPVYVEVEDGERLMRALKREQMQETPKYAEMCRRFLADSEDFSEDKLRAAGVERRFVNSTKEACIEEICEFIRSV